MSASDYALITVYRSLVKAETYLYLDHREGFERVPEELAKQFGHPGKTSKVTTIRLDAERKLARVSAARVLEQVREQGFFLQLPPPPDPLDPSEGRPLPR